MEGKQKETRRWKSMMVFWVVTPCGIVSRYQRFGGTQTTVPIFSLGVTTHKTNIDIFTAVRTSDLIKENDRRKERNT
jgi:hypothetical protein